jgi:signal peptidase II
MTPPNPDHRPGTDRRSSPGSRSRAAITVLVAAGVIVADQLTKTWALKHTYPPRHVFASLWLELTFNTGAAFGLGKGVTPVVEAGVIVLVVGLLLGARRTARRGSLSEALAIGLLVGGALSNLADRLLRHIPGHPGAVVDWIEVAQVGGHQYWPVFNLADASVVVGAILLAWRLVVRSGRERERLGPQVPETGAGAPDGHGDPSKRSVAEDDRLSRSTTEAVPGRSSRSTVDPAPADSPRCE